MPDDNWEIEPPAQAVQRKSTRVGDYGAYLKQLSDKTRVRRELDAEHQTSDITQRERGFTVYASGANRNTAASRGPPNPKAAQRKTWNNTSEDESVIRRNTNVDSKFSTRMSNANYKLPPDHQDGCGDTAFQNARPMNDNAILQQRYRSADDLHDQRRGSVPSELYPEGFERKRTLSDGESPSGDMDTHSSGPIVTPRSARRAFQSPLPSNVGPSAAGVHDDAMFTGTGTMFEANDNDMTYSFGEVNRRQAAKEFSELYDPHISPNAPARCLADDVDSLYSTSSKKHSTGAPSAAGSEKSSSRRASSCQEDNKYVYVHKHLDDTARSGTMGLPPDANNATPSSIHDDDFEPAKQAVARPHVARSRPGDGPGPSPRTHDDSDALAYFDKEYSDADSSIPASLLDLVDQLNMLPSPNFSDLRLKPSIRESALEVTPIPSEMDSAVFNAPGVLAVADAASRLAKPGATVPPKAPLERQQTSEQQRRERAELLSRNLSIRGITPDDVASKMRNLDEGEKVMLLRILRKMELGDQESTSLLRQSLHGDRKPAVPIPKGAASGAQQDRRAGQEGQEGQAGHARRTSQTSQAKLPNYLSPTASSASKQAPKVQDAAQQPPQPPQQPQQPQQSALQPARKPVQPVRKQPSKRRLPPVEQISLPSYNPTPIVFSPPSMNTTDVSTDGVEQQTSESSSSQNPDSRFLMPQYESEPAFSDRILSPSDEPSCISNKSLQEESLLALRPVTNSSRKSGCQVSFSSFSGAFARELNVRPRDKPSGGQLGAAGRSVDKLGLLMKSMKSAHDDSSSDDSDDSIINISGSDIESFTDNVDSLLALPPQRSPRPHPLSKSKNQPSPGSQSSAKETPLMPAARASGGIENSRSTPALRDTASGDVYVKRVPASSELTPLRVEATNGERHPSGTPSYRSPLSSATRAPVRKVTTSDHSRLSNASSTGHSLSFNIEVDPSMPTWQRPTSSYQSLHLPEIIPPIQGSGASPCKVSIVNSTLEAPNIVALVDGKVIEYNNSMSCAAVFNDNLRAALNISGDRLADTLGPVVDCGRNLTTSCTQSDASTVTPSKNGDGSSATGHVRTPSSKPGQLGRQSRLFIVEITSCYATADSIGTLLPLILVQDKPVIYTAEYYSYNTGLRKKLVCNGPVSIVDCIPSKEFSIFLYLHTVYDSSAKYVLSQDNRRRRMKVSLPKDLRVSLYSYEDKQPAASSSSSATPTIRPARADSGIPRLPSMPVQDICSSIAFDKRFCSAHARLTHEYSGTLGTASTAVTGYLDVTLRPAGPRGAPSAPVPKRGYYNTSAGSTNPSKGSWRTAQIATRTPAQSDSPKLMKNEFSVVGTSSKRAGSSASHYEVLLTLKSNYGDEHQIGLTALQFYDHIGNEVFLPGNSITCTSINYNGGKSTMSPQVLINGECRTVDPRFMWLNTFSRDKPVVLKIMLPKNKRVSAIRFWNYNRDSSHATKGVRQLTITLDGSLVRECELQIAPGTLNMSALSATIVSFTTITGLLKKIQAFDRFKSYVEEDMVLLQGKRKSLSAASDPQAGSGSFMGKLSTSATDDARSENAQHAKAAAKEADTFGPAVDCAANAFMPQNEVRRTAQKNCCFFGPLSSATLSILVLGTEDTQSSRLSIGNMFIVNQDGVLLSPCAVEVLGDNCSHEIRGTPLRSTLSWVSLVTSVNRATPRQAQCVANNVQAPLWTCVGREGEPLLGGCEAGVGISLRFTVPKGVDDSDAPHYIQSVVVTNLSTFLEDCARSVLIFVNGQLWTPFPGELLMPSILYASACLLNNSIVQQITQRFRCITRSRPESDDVDADFITRFMQRLRSPRNNEAPSVYGPSLNAWSEVYNSNPLFGCSIVLPHSQPLGALKVMQTVTGVPNLPIQMGELIDISSISLTTILTTTYLLYKGASMREDDDGTLKTPRSQGLVYSKQQTDFGQLMYAMPHLPRCHVLTICFYSRYRDCSAYTNDVVKKAMKNTSDSAFLFGLSRLSLLSAKGNEIPLDVNGRGIYSAILSQKLQYKATRAGIALGVSDKKHPASNLLTGMPWLASYNFTSTSSSVSSETLAKLVRSYGTSTKVSSPYLILASLSVVSNESFELGQILLENVGSADIGISIDGRFITYGRLENTNGLQCISFSKTAAFGKPFPICSEASAVKIVKAAE